MTEKKDERTTGGFNNYNNTSRKGITSINSNGRIDASGKQLSIKNETINAGNSTINLNVAALKTGIYYIQVVSSTRNETLKLIKE